MIGIDDYLLNYGVLGIWTLFNISTILYYRKRDEEERKYLISVIEKNTSVISKFMERQDLIFKERK